MSKTIDERVVSMEFDNSRFEKNVATTMSTLDKLKQKLNLDGAAKGFENIDSAAKKVNLSGLSNAADQVAVKFSTMQMTIQHQLDRIVDSAVDAGVKLAKSLSVDQITAGWAKYGQKTASVQTIMNATGKSIDEVNNYLEKLMWFSDETSYGFTDMTSALGTMTASGGDIDKLIPMLMGVANATAYAGKSASEFSRVMQYGVNQAYSLGYMQLRDWMTIQNAGVNSAQLIQTLIDSGVALGKIAEGEVSVSNFTSTLADKWLDTDVMEAAFGKFAEMTELAYEMVNSGEVDTASKAYAILSKEYDGISITAAKAAQEAKTFTEAIDATKDAVSSKWLSTFELIFGNYSEAKTLWTDVANQLWDIFASGGDARNELLADALDSNWNKLKRNLSDAGVSTEAFSDAVRKTLTDNGKDVEALIDEFDTLENAITSGAIESDILRKALRNINTTVGDLTKIERILNFGKTGDDVKELQKTLEELGHSVGEFGIDGSLGPDTRAAIKEFQELHGLIVDGIVGPETLKALKQAQKETSKWNNENEELITSFDDLINSIDKMGGRELIAKSITNALEGLGKVVTTVKEAFANVFNISPDTIYGIVEAIHSFSEKLIMSDETADKFRSTLEGLFAIIDSIRIILSGAFKIAFSIFTAVFSKAGSSVLDITSRMGDSFVSLRDTVKTVVDNITSFFTEQIPQWIEEFKQTEFFKTVATWFEEASGTISGAIDTISSKFDNFEAPAFIQKISLIGEYVKGLGDKLAETGIGSTVIDGFTAAFDKIRGFFAAIPKWTATDFANIFASFEGADITSFPSALATFAKSISNTVISKTKKFFKNLTGISWDDFKGTALDKFMDIWISISEKAKEWASKGKEFGESLKTFIFGTEPITLPVILEVAEKILGIVVLIKALNLLSGVIKPFDNITDAIDNFANALKWAAISSTFKSMAIALGALTLCIVVLTQIDDMNKAVTAAKMLGQLIVVMGAVALLMGVTSSKLGANWDTLSVALSMLAMIGALVLLVYAMKELDAMEFKDPTRTFAILTGALLALVIGMSAIAIAGGSSFKSVAAILTMITALKMLLGVIDEYEQHDWTGQSKAIRKMTEMLLILSAALAITSIGAGGSTGLALTIIAMVLSLKLLLNAIKEFADVDDATMERGGQAVVKLLCVMTLMGVALSLANSTTVLGKGQRSVNSFRGLAVSLLAVVAAIWLLGKMATKDEATFTNGMEAVITILGMFAVALGIIGLASNGLNTSTVISMLVMIGVLLAEMAIILKLMETIPVTQSLGTAAAITMIMLAMIGMLSTIKHGVAQPKVIANWIVMMGALGALIAGLGLVIKSMADVPWQNALGSAAAMSLLLSVMSLSLSSLTKLVFDPNGLALALVALATLGLIVWEIGAILRKLTANGLDESAIGPVIALSALLYAMTGALAILTKVPPVDKTIIGKLATLAAIGVLLYGLGQVLKSMNGVENAIQNATALSMLAIALSLCTLALAGASYIAPSIGPGVLALVALVASLGLLVSHLSTITNVDVARENAITLSNLAIVLSLCTIPLAVSGLIAPAATSGILALVAIAAMLGLLVSHLSTISNIDVARENAITLSNLAIVLSLCTIPLAVAAVIAPASIIGAGLLAALAVVLGVLVWGLSAIKDTETARANVETIIMLVGSLTSMILLIGSLGVNSVIAVYALESLIVLVGKIGLLAAAIALLTNDGTLIDKGLEMLKKIAKGLGEVISDFGVGLTSGLPAIAENLSGFADKLGTFVSVMNDVDVGIVDKAKNLADAIVSLTKGNFLNSLASFGDGTMSTLGEELSNFAEKSEHFIAAMDNMKPETAANMETFANALSTLNYVCGDNNLTNGSITKFSEGISDFAKCIKDASIVLNDITDEDVANIERSAVAGEALAELNKCIPRSDGWLQEIAGKKDLAEWGAKISAFADSLIAYSNKITGNPIDSEAIKTSAEAGTAIADLNNSIPRDGGEWQKFAGSNDIAVWGTKIVTFAQALVDYSNTVTGNTFDKQAILDSAEAASALAEVNAAIPKQDGWWQLKFGDQDMAAFGNDLKAFAGGLVTFGNAALEITQDKIDAIKRVGTAVDEIQLVIDKLDKTGGTADWFGNRDPEAFGSGIQALAKGVKDCITVSTKIEDTTSITKLGDAVTAINDVVDLIDNSWVNSVTLGYVECFKSMGIGLKDACDTIKTISNTSYDFSNIESLKLEMSGLSEVFNDISIPTMLTDWTNVTDIAAKIVETANSLASINSTTYGGIDTLKGALNNLSGANIDGVIETFTGKTETITAAVSGVVSAIGSGLSNGVTTVSTAMSELMSASLTAIDEKKESFKTAGQGLVSKVVSAFSEGIKDVRLAASVLGMIAVNAVNSNYNNMYSAGKNLGDGLILGINAKINDGTVYWAAYRLGQEAVRGEKDGQESNSPSKATIKAGKWLGEGLVIGMQRIGSSVYNAGKSMGKNAVGSIADSIRTISNTIDADMDLQPTIRPVLDLSDVRSGANAIGGLLGAGAPIGVQANISSISSMMNSRGQNGINSDVVSAIDKLRKDIGNINTNSYNINGINVSEGTDAADAIHTLVRVIKMEGRS